MKPQDFVQLMCNHKFAKHQSANMWYCRCGLEIFEQDLLSLSPDLFKGLTTWLAYHAKLD